MQTPNHEPSTPHISKRTVENKLKPNLFSTYSHRQNHSHSRRGQYLAHAQIYTPYHPKEKLPLVDTKSQMMIMLFGITLGIFISIAIGFNLEPKILAYSIAILTPLLMGYILKTVYVYTMQHLEDPF